MRHRLERLLDAPYVPLLAALVSLVLGLVFVFVWAPHPWGWHGIDQYHELARALARGEPFGTTDVPWGYAYFVAAFYVAFGERAWIPVTAQVVANTAIPVMLYHLVRPYASTRIAALASLLVGVFSFNTVYASTQSSDSMCTVLFVAALLCFARGDRHAGHARGWGYFALSGLLAGTVPQFRPNMLLLPLVIAGLYPMLRRRTQAVGQMLVFLAFVAAALSPWVIRNYRLTGAILPTSTHGGVQLWYGTLQVGPYLEGRSYNPRAAFEAASFDYTTLAGRTIVVTAERDPCGPGDDTLVELVYWTDRDGTRRRLRPQGANHGTLLFELPGQPAPTAVYYYAETRWIEPATGEGVEQTNPPDGATHPFVFFVADDHLVDLDRHQDLLDVFDLIRLVRRVAWGEELTTGGEPPQGDVRTDEDVLRDAVVRLLGDGATAEAVAASPLVHVTDDRATLRLADGSSLTVPRTFSGLVTDLEVHGTLARSLVTARRPWHEPPRRPNVDIDVCRGVWNVRANDVFYRKEPHQMQRYMALAFDNIRRDPWAFAAASLYRMGRLFVVRGTDDRNTAQQFEGSGPVYVAGLMLSAVYLLLFASGVIVAWRRRRVLLVFLVPIVYVPLTIAFVLTNMRYTVTVQPLMFVFVSVALLAAARIPLAPDPASR